MYRYLYGTIPTRGQRTLVLGFVLVLTQLHFYKRYQIEIKLKQQESKQILIPIISMNNRLASIECKTDVKQQLHRSVVIHSISATIGYERLFPELSAGPR